MLLMVGSGSSLLYKGAPKHKHTSLMKVSREGLWNVSKSNEAPYRCICILEIYVQLALCSPLCATAVPNDFDVQIKSSPIFQEFLWAIGSVVTRMECAYPRFVISEPEKKSSSDSFRSSDLRVMSPARFHCATLLVASITS